MVTQKAVIWGQGNSEIFSMLSIIFTNAVDTTSSAASSDFTIFERNALKEDTMLMEYPLYQRTLFIIQNAK